MRLALAAVVAGASVLFAPAAARPTATDSDTAPPVLQAISVSPSAVDVTTGSATVTVTATITDDLSGVDAGGATQMGIESPSNAQIAAGSLFLVSGNTYSATLTIPQFAEAGTWHLRYATLRDLAGNSRSMFESDLANAGFATAVQVASAADTAPPTLSGLALSPSSVDVTTGPATVNVTATITDDRSGVKDGDTQMGIESSPDAQIVGAGLSHSSGNTYIGTLTIPQGAAAGTWHLRWVTLVDNAGNHRSVFRDELASLGFTAAVAVISASADTTPPTLRSLTINPTSVDVGNGPATITATATITDDRSGVVESCGCAGNQIALEHSATAQVVSSTFSHRSGDTWVATLTVPQGAATGTWRLRLISVRDNAGNSKSYFASDLAALGLAPQIGVSATGQPAPSTPPYTGTPQPTALASGVATAKPDEAGAVKVAPGTPSGPSANVSWPPGAFASDVTVKAATATVGYATGALFAGAYGIQLTVTSVGDGIAVTKFTEPLDLAFTGVDRTTRPAYSRDDVTWVEIPLIHSTVLGEAAPDGYYWHGDTLHVLTRHATIFGLFHKLSGSAAVVVHSKSRTATLKIKTSVSSNADVRLMLGRRLIGRWHGAVATRAKTVTVRLAPGVKKGMRLKVALSVAVGAARFSAVSSAIAR